MTLGSFGDLERVRVLFFLSLLRQKICDLFCEQSFFRGCC